MLTIKFRVLNCMSPNCAIHALCVRPWISVAGIYAPCVGNNVQCIDHPAPADASYLGRTCMCEPGYGGLPQCVELNVSVLTLK